MVVTRSWTLNTQGQGQVLDITPRVAQEVAGAGVREGIVTVFVAGSTAGVGIIENEPGLIRDFQEMWERLAPQGLSYEHHKQPGEANGHSHLRATLLGPSLTIPFTEGGMMLGTWQQIILTDFDVRTRRREIVLQIIGE